MIPKLVINESYDFGERSTNLVKQTSAGVDSEYLRKHAAMGGMFADSISKLETKPGRSVIHIIALGDEERYGPNRNGDAFSTDDTRTAHVQFKNNGHVFVDHQNKDPAKSVGTVLDTAHNDDMRRVELLVEVEHDKVPKRYRDKLEDGDDLAWSMGSMQPYDVCSHCGHKAPTARDHCDHIKEALMEILDDGSQVYMKNPDPNFFDISIVGRPADRVGYSLRKVAYGNGVVGGHALAEELGMTPMSVAKTATLVRLAEMEKQVPVKGRTLPLKASTKREIKCAVQSFGVGPTLMFLHKQKCLLSPEDFAELIVGHSNPEAAGDAVSSGPCMHDLVSEPDDVPALDGGESRYIDLSGAAIHDLSESTGMDAVPHANRIVRITILLPKTAGVQMDPTEAHGFGLLYQHYKLAFATHHFQSPEVLWAVASTR